MGPIIKQIMYGDYYNTVPAHILGEYLEKYYLSGGMWDIMAALDEWIRIHRKRRKKR